ncbi:piggyBac transposable element-derived protein 2-like, partial [Musca vetustissima]|uniref:piggyBac transposable element-derived protein 2-like n=1 Tax=Musca vetustissima TaxID=27455 RepID=UPI002AB794DB
MPYDFLVYQGSTTPINQNMVKTVGFGSTTQRIPKNEIGHKLFFDNYFPSYQLFEMLKRNKINAAGTIRVNRFANPRLPVEKEMKQKGRGSSAECISADGNVIVTRWFDNRTVNLGSNFVGIGKQDKVKRWDKNKNDFVVIDRPEVVRMYNESMGGVDLLDQVIQYYRINIRSVKWTLRVIMHFVDLALTAAWMEYRRDCLANNIQKNKILDSMNFRIQVARTLVGAQQDYNPTTNTTRGRGRPPNPPSGRDNTTADSSLDGSVSSESDSEESPPPKKNKTFQRQPPQEVRLDQKLHIPCFVQAKSAGRCKANG